MTNKEKFIALVHEYLRILNIQQDSIFIIEAAFEFDPNMDVLGPMDTEELRIAALIFVEDSQHLSNPREKAEVASSWISQMKYNH